MRLDASDLAAAAMEISEARDPAIKLFGRTIPLPENQAPPPAASAAEDGEAQEMETEGERKVICQDTASTEVMVSTSVPQDLDQGELNSSACLNNNSEDDQQTSTSDHKVVSDPKPEQDQPEADTSGQDKVLKKPDKILPCPRCNSLDTKFCYYNNYNVNQPRHFCKNCQRYWTAGGMMRNVPVGAGRRKNKHSSSHYRQIMMPSDAMTSVRIDAPESHPSGPGSTRFLKGNGTVLKFGAEAPLCDSMSSVLNLQEPQRNDDFSSVASGENKEEPSCASSLTASNCMENGQPENPLQLEQNSIQGYQNGVAPMHHIQCYPGPPWTYPWGPGWNNAAAVLAGQCSEIAYGSDNSNRSPIPWNAPPLVAAPAFCAPAIPVPFMPASFWGFMPGWTGGSWNLPMVGTNGGLSPSSSTSTSGCSSNSSPSLGKHSRDTSSQVEEKVEKSLWVPKTLRIDDPDEAAKSSIWDTLGIKPDEGVMLKAFRSKAEKKGQISDSSRALHANPAAFSRSQSFQEST